MLDSVPLGRNDFEGFATRRIYNVFAKTRALDDLALAPLLEGVLDRVLGLHQFSAPVGIEIGPGRRHRSCTSTIRSIRCRGPIPRSSSTACGRSTTSRKRTARPGSSREAIGGQPREYDPDEPTIPLEMPAGSVVFYTGTVLHKGGANTTNRPRLGVILEYCAGWIRAQENHVIGVPQRGRSHVAAETAGAAGLQRLPAVHRQCRRQDTRASTSMRTSDSTASC